MKHAIMVMGYGDGKILQHTINVLDDYEIDFYIHWDKKYSIPNLKSKMSNIYFINNRIKVYWGTDTQTIVEKMLMESVYKTHKYGYVHLISSNDMPLMTPEYLKKYFLNRPYCIGFLDYLDRHIYNRINGYFPIRHLNVRSSKKFWLLLKPISYINEIIGVNRLKNLHVEKGCNWFSMNIDCVERVIHFKNFKMFTNTFTGDEFYVQTILQDLKPKGLSKKYNYYSDDYRMTMSSKMSSRYINWLEGHGKPYVFNKEDVKFLKQIVNTDYAFGRKLNDPYIIDEVFDNIN